MKHDPNAQILFIGGSTEPVYVMRSWKASIDASLIFELEDGTFAYPNGEVISDPEVVKFMPEIHRKRALNFINQNKPSSKRSTEADHNLMALKRPALIGLAGLNEKEARGLNKEKLVAIIQEKAEAVKVDSNA